MPAETFARLAAFAIGEPEDVGISEILFLPTVQELRGRAKGSRPRVTGRKSVGRRFLFRSAR